MHITTIDQKGIDLIKSFEGYSATAYLCPAGVWTIGYGTTRYPNGQRVQEGDILGDGTFSSDGKSRDAVYLLKHDVAAFELAVDSLTRDDINQNQFNALVSFAYNVGSNNLKNSTLLKKVNKDPNDPTIKAEFGKWVNAGGRKLNGLVKRRAAEAEMYFS